MNSNRRKFIRLLGGGVVIAAAGVSGCSTRYPEAAVAAWNGPGDEPDLRRWALAYAILAPNSHNRQPWLVDLDEPNAITLFVDRERMLPMTDPWFRQILVSQGTFLESLVIALIERGIAPQVQLFPEGEFSPREVDARPVAYISWTPSAQVTQAQSTRGVPKDPLFGQLLRRQTAKVAYDTRRAVPAEVLDTLRSAFTDPNIGFGATVAIDRVEALRQLCLEAAKVEILTPRTVMESVELTRVGPEEIALYRDGISVNDRIPRIANALGAFDRTKPPAEGTVAYQKTMERFEQHSLTAMGFVWLATPTAKHTVVGMGRRAEVNAGRAYMRLQLKATELGLQVHPMSQAPQEFPEMKLHYDKLHTLLVGKPATEETVQMFCRVGYCAEQQHTPRRALQGFIKT